MATMNKPVKTTIYLLILLTAIVVMASIKLPNSSFLWQAISNTGHMPAFGVLAVMMISLSKSIYKDRISNNFWHYLLAFLFSSGAGMAVEFMQMFGSRDADMGDILRNELGILIFLGVYLTRDKNVFDDMNYLQKRWRSILKVLLVVITILSVSPVFLWGGAYFHRANSFPLICDFDSYWDSMFWEINEVGIEITDVSDKWPNKTNSKAASLTFVAEICSGFGIVEPERDWSKYKTFAFDIYSSNLTPVNLSLRIEDQYHNSEFSDRFGRTMIINPGLNNIEIPLFDIEASPIGRKLDLKSVGAIHFFAYKPKVSFSLYLSNIRLK